MDGFGISGQLHKHGAVSAVGSPTSQTQLSEPPTGPTRPQSESRSDGKNK